MKQPSRWALLLLLLLALAFVSIANVREFNPDDESLYVHIAKEMYGKGELWIPSWCGSEAYFKPPLVYWILMTGFMMGGVSLVAARIPIVLLTLATVLLAFLIAKDLYGKRDGVLAALFTATSLGIIIYGRIAMMDLPLCFFITLSAWCFIRALDTAHPFWTVAFLAAGGLSTLIKGPISLVIILSAAFTCCLIFKRHRHILNGWFVAGAAAALFFMLLWPAVLAMRGEFSHWYGFFIVRENLGKFSDIRYPVHTFLASYLIYLFPWTPLLISSLWILIREKLYREERLMVPLIWAAAVLVMHLLPATKLKHYTIPAIPLTMVFISAMAGSWGADRAMKRGIIALQALLVLLFIVFAAAARTGTTWGDILLAGGALVALLASWRTSGGKDGLSAGAFFYGAALLCILPFIGNHSFERLPQGALPHLEGKVAAVRIQIYIHTYFLGRPVEQIDNPVDFNRVLQEGGRVIISETDFDEFGAVRGFKLAPVEKIYSWKQWRTAMPLPIILEAFLKGDTAPLIDTIHVVRLKKQKEPGLPVPGSFTSCLSPT
ncbi:MAG: glycosyltransferase family 39 protein [Candidatus Eremiobacteraeota bacterium]|nr:glycosyltransferase family 39 protein [Candidatus Eremiobacteraeota bacterium]